MCRDVGKDRSDMEIGHNLHRTERRRLYENATHQLRNATKTQRINFTKAQEKDIEKRMT